MCGEKFVAKLKERRLKLGAREVIGLGHEVKLIAPHYVKPFVKRQKKNAAEAEAIVIAAQRPEMRFVEPKSAEQESRAILFCARERLVHQRTKLVNALRASLYEYGHVVPQGSRRWRLKLTRRDRLQTIPGVGPLTALAVEAFAPSMECFSCGRDFAAWPRFTPVLLRW
ncbi:transposase [Mesorhizobium sp. VK9D]|nr:transposase [Mesorhizobium sp. VK9D]MDX8455300.1 transposase [Mesorhizobium sp. VK9D]